jgi:hypothetical protein
MNSCGGRCSSFFRWKETSESRLFCFGAVHYLGTWPPEFQARFQSALKAMSVVVQGVRLPPEPLARHGAVRVQRFLGWNDQEALVS